MQPHTNTIQRSKRRAFALGQILITPGADGIDIYSGTQKMCGGRVKSIPHVE